jgi:hypothetical protein
MRIAATVFFAAAAVATSAAASSHLTDVEYLQAARCAGLAASENLGAVDAKSFDALMKAEGKGRAGYILAKAEEARDNAKRDAKRAKAERKTTLLAERSGACQRYVETQPTLALK